MKALITGIAGFTGKYLTRTLQMHGMLVSGISQDGTAISNVSHVYEGSITDLELIREIVSREQPDYVIHLAAISYVLHKDVEEIYRTNIVGTRNLLQALSEQVKIPKAILIASSSNVYGNRHHGMLNESLEVAPVNDYSVSKVATEHVAHLFSNKLPIIVTRPFNYTGIGQSSEFLIPKIVNAVRAGSRSIMLGNLNVARDFSDVRTVADVYATLLQCPAAYGQTVNVCSGKAYRLFEILDMVRDISGYAIEVQVASQLMRSNEVTALWGDASRLQGLIGPVGGIDLPDTLRWMIEAREN